MPTFVEAVQTVEDAAELRRRLAERIDAPLGRVAVQRPRAVFARSDRSKFEFGMSVEELDEALADGPRPTQDSDSYTHVPTSNEAPCKYLSTGSESAAV